MHETIAAFAGALLIALAAAAFRPGLKAELRRLGFWTALIGGASLAGAVSALVWERGHAGTGFVIRRGWPKPYWFDFAGEYGERSTALEPHYFAGNVLAWAAAFLLAWASWRIVRPSAASAPPGT